jgi:hypothetical protein
MSKNAFLTLILPVCIFLSSVNAAPAGEIKLADRALSILHDAISGVVKGKVRKRRRSKSK